MRGKKKSSEQSENVTLESMDIAKKKREQLKACLGQEFPEVFVDHGIDFDLLKRVLGEWVDPGKERFGLTWPGKAECMRIIQQPSVGTLKPIRNESVNFDDTGNVFIEGDNLEVLKLLQKAYFGKVKMIYIDPPYNTGNDFIYPDKYSETLATYLEYTSQIDSRGRKFSTNTDSAGRYHSRWLNMMYPRLYLARNLLSEDGVIFVSIDDSELNNLRAVCDQIFGGENFVATFVWDGGRKNDSKRVSVGHEYIVCYARSSGDAYEDKTIWKERKEGIDAIYKVYEKSKVIYGDDWQTVSQELQKFYSDLRGNHPAKAHKHYRFADENGVYFASDLSGPDDGRKNRPRYEIRHPVTGVKVPVPARGWRWEKPRMLEEIKRNRVHFGTDEASIPNGKVYLHENEYQAPSSVFYKDRRSASSSLKKIFDGNKVFDFPKDTSILERLLTFVCRDNDVVLDFFAGSGSLGEAVFNYNRRTSHKIRFILVQLPEPLAEDSRPFGIGMKTIADIARERLRRIGASHKGQGDFGPSENERSVDYGFRVVSLDRSNFRLWDGSVLTEKALAQQLSMHVDHIDSGSEPEDILFELLLKSGIPLTARIQILKLAGKEVYSVQEGTILICLEREITPDLIDALAEAKPLQVICLDEGFRGNDKLKANAVQTFKVRAQAEESEIVFRTV